MPTDDAEALPQWGKRNIMDAGRLFSKARSATAKGF